MYFIEFIVAFFATAAFSILFNVPRKQWAFAGLTGGAGWLCYRLVAAGTNVVLATFLAVIVVTLLSRAFAVIRKSPVTVFLVSGIFPLVPGVGIYYTSYYFMMSDLSLASQKGVETLKVAVAIAIGIMCVLIIPQKVFSLFERKSQRLKEEQ